MRTRIIPLSDSRGGGLTSCLHASQEINRRADINGRSLSGATLETLLGELKERKERYRGDRIIALIYGGICNLTSRQGNKYRKNLQVFYNRNQENLNQIKATIRRFIQIAKSPKFELVLSTIIPANLSKANKNFVKEQKLIETKYRYTEPQLESQQNQLEEDTVAINEYIIQECKKNNITFFNPIKAVQRSSIKGDKRKKRKRSDKFTYERLWDGVHPNEELKKELFNKILNLFTQKTIGLRTPTPPKPGKTRRESSSTKKKVELSTPVDQSTEDTQSEDETLAFKRRKKYH